MKRLFILISLFLVLFSISVLAERYIEYEFREAIIDVNGNFIETDNEVEDVNVLGFVCANKDCSNVKGTLFNGEILNSGEESEMTLVFPTQLQSKQGYGVYKYKDVDSDGVSYIPWESNPTWHGTKGSDPQGPFVDYLTRVEGCSAPIDQFVVVNDAEAHIPLVIGVDASLDATLHAALDEAGPLDYIPEILREHYSVRTLVSLTIRNADTFEIVHEDSIEVLMPAGESRRIEFTWTPEEDGRYEATAVTDVIDGKCISSISQEVSKEFNVLEEYPRGICYTLLNNMDLSEEFPEEGDTEEVSVWKISNHADNETTVTLTPIGTDLTFTVYDPEGNVVSEKSKHIEANNNPFDSKKVEFSWNIPIDIVSGLYKLAITGIGTNSICDNLDNLADTISTTVLVRGTAEPDNEAPVITSTPVTLALEGLQYEYDVEAVDPNGDSLTFNLLQGPKGMSIDSNSGLIQWVPKNSDLGQHNIVVAVSDGFLQDTQSYALNVADEDSDVGEKVRPHKFSISNLILSDYSVKTGDNLIIYVGLSNRGRRNEDSIRVWAVSDYGEISLPTVVNLGSVEKNWVFLDLDVPHDLKRGEYVVEVIAENDEFRDVRFDSFSVT